MIAFRPTREVSLFGSVLLLLTTAMPLATLASEQTQPVAPLLVLESIEVSPSQLGPETLCRLKVRLRNNGKQTATDFTFEVTLNGEPLAVYANHSWRVNVAPGKDDEVQLYNFWTSESGRPPPRTASWSYRSG